jgi:GT2 family glycosyltransferase
MLPRVKSSPERTARAAKSGARRGPAISVIIAIEDHRSSGLAVVEAFFDQTAPRERFEVLVVAWRGGASLAVEIDRLRSRPDAPKITYLECEARGRAAKNNLGVAHASAPILCFCGDDFVPRRTFVAAHLAYHESHPEPTRVAIGAGFSPESIRAASPFIAWLEDSGDLFGVRFRDPRFSLPSTFFYVANSSIKRSLCERAGAFDERLPYPACDDSDYGERLVALGMLAELVPEASCNHDHLFTLEGRLVNVRWAGASHAILTAAEPSALRRARRSVALDLAPLAAWCRSILCEGPRIARWRWKLAAAYRFGYRRQVRRARESQPLSALESVTRPG